MSTTISKTTFTFTVLHRTDSPPATLEEALEEATDGHAVGSLPTPYVTVEVPDDQVRDELIALGNSGDFFDEDLNPDEDFVLDDEDDEDDFDLSDDEDDA